MKPRRELSWTLLLVAVFGGQATLGQDGAGGALDVHGILQELDRAQNTDAARDDRESGVRRQWGVPDTTAAAGRLFNYTIPADAFAGDVARYVVTEAGETSLPPWLHFIELTRTFIGVPLDSNVGQHYISVKALAKDANKIEDKSSVAKDVFSIDVLEEAQTFQMAMSANELSQPELTRCPSTDPVTVATLILDADAASLDPLSRVHLLKGILRFLELSPSAVKMTAMAEDSHAYDNSAIMAGPGDSGQRKQAGVQLQWRVGCGSSVDSAHAASLQKLEPAARNGVLSKELGHPVVGWHVTSVQPRVTRRKRARAEAFYGAATPVPGLRPTIRPTITEHVMEPTEQLGVAPESRIVPTMSSPSFGGASHHHRHHHGEHGSRSHHPHHHQYEGMITASPAVTHHYVLPTAALGYTPPLPPLRPTHPTSSIGGLEPSRSFPDEVTPTFTPDFVPPIPTSDFVVEPSVTADVPVEPTRVPGTPKKPTGLNSKPELAKRVKKLVMTAGKVWSFQIPADTFVDLEDGDTRNLKLMFLTSAGTAIEQHSWIQFDPEKQTLSALPLDENIGKYSFKLEAMDREGATVHDMLDINVWQHSGSRVTHHKFTAVLKPKRWEYVNSIEWQIAAVRRIGKFFGERDESHITVLAATQDPVTLTWTNDSLPTHPCPREAVNALYSRMVTDKGTNMTTAFKKALGNLKVQEVSLEYMGVCRTAAPSKPPIHNEPPEKRNAIGQINATVGEILRYKIPEDTFFDSRDGVTPFLKLSFLTMDNVHLPESSWIQFNPKTQELYGLPFDTDVRRHEFQMVAMDSEGLSVSDVFVVVVQPRSQKKWAVEFSLHIDEDFAAFNRNISRKVLVAWKLARLYGDHDPRYITVSSISAGSVVYAWTNNTLPYEPCPASTIRRLMGYLVNDNRTLTQRLVDEMKPEFHILKTDTMPLGLCLDQGLPSTSVVNTEAAPPVVDPDVTPSDDDIYITTIIPAVVIAVMLLLAAIVACFLYRKKRKGKMTMQDSSTFINKGIPIIFADELDDKPDPAKPPVIMKDERPPLPPPEYPRSAGSSRGSTPQTDRRRAHPPLRDTPYQQPTPPFAGSRDSRHSRPKAAPTYRQPPPYVPP